MKDFGALRVFRTGRTRSCEEIIALEPGKRFGYALRSGLPLRDYRAYVDLTPDGEGTAIHWHSTFTGKVPGTGWCWVGSSRARCEGWSRRPMRPGWRAANRVGGQIE